MASNIESENNENVSFDSNQISSDEQLTQLIDSINQDTNTEESPRTPGQTAIGAKLVKKLEILAANSKESSSKTPSTTTASAATPISELDSDRSINKSANNLTKNLTDPDPQKNLLALATTLAELQEQNRLTHSKLNEIEKRSTVLMRERDQILLENGRTTAAKTKLESLCRELHRHNQQIRDESVQRQQDDETKRRELATKFQTTIDEIASQLSNYSEKSTSLREKNVQLSEQLASVVKDYELREKEIEMELKKKQLELRLTEVSLEQSHALLNERTELIKQERQVTEAERLVLYKKCEELASAELTLRSQLTVYTERYQDFQNAIQQSSEMVTSCHTEIEKMGKRIKKLEKERNDFRHQWEIAEQNQRKSIEDMKLMEKEKRQLDIKLDKLDRLCRVLQQERSDLQGTIKSLTKLASNVSAVTSVENSASKNDQSPNLYDSELGRIANTVD